MIQWHLLEEIPIDYEVTYDGLRDFFEEAEDRIKEKYPRYNMFNYLKSDSMDGSRILLYGAYEK